MSARRTERKLRKARRRLVRELSDHNAENPETHDQFHALVRQAREDRGGEQRRGPHITDHAILRYLERIEGIDIEAVRSRIADETVIEAARSFRRCCVPVGQSHRCVVQDGTVVTVLRITDVPSARPPRGGR